MTVDKIRDELLDIYEDSQYKNNTRTQLKHWLEHNFKIKLFWDDNEAGEAGVEEGLLDTRTVGGQQ